MFSFPASWKILALRKSVSNNGRVNFYLYNSVYYFTFCSPRTAEVCTVGRETNTIFFSQKYTDPLYTLFIHSLRHTLRSISSLFFLKVKFKGKGYYVYKNARNTIAPQFGYAHRIYVYAFNTSVKFLSKTSVLLFGLSNRDLITVGQDFRSKRYINIFTGRGVRFSRQVVYRKTGKVSSYR